MLSLRSYCFYFWGFSHAHPVTVEGLCYTIQLTLHSQPWLFYDALCSLQVFVHIAGNAQMSLYKCTYLHSWKHRQDLCICFNLWFKTSCWRPRTQVEESWNGLRNEQSRANTSPRLKWKLFQTKVPSAFTLESES